MINRLAIVGVGLIGGSIGLAAKATGAAAHVVGVESNANTWGDALHIGAVDEITNDLAAGVRGACLVILAVPVGVVLEMLPLLPALISADTIVSDTGSVKGAITEAGFAALGDRFVPGHPMAGSERGGVLHARADLFAGATWAITAPEGGASATVAAFADSLGASSYFLSPAAHDETVALTSHLPHVLAYILGAMAFDRRVKGDTAPARLAAGSWHSATRVAESPPSLWAGIIHQNRELVAKGLDECAEKLMWVAERLRLGDEPASLHDLFLSGHAERLTTNKDRGG